MPPDPKTSQSPRTAQVALGVVICWQLWFLVSHNVCRQIEGWQESWQETSSDKRGQVIELVAPEFVKGHGHVYDAAKWVRQTNQPYEHATGQLQMWSLFPGGYHDLIFAAMVFRDDNASDGDYPASDDPGPDGTVPGRPYKMFLSRHEPADRDAYFRVGQMRWRRYETSMVFALRPSEGETDDERDRRWNTRIKDHFDRNADWLFAFMKVRTKEILAEHPDQPMPRQVVMLMRRYQTRSADESPPHWDGPFVVPLASWTPPAAGEAGWGEKRRYNPERGRFRSVE